MASLILFLIIALSSSISFAGQIYVKDKLICLDMPSSPSDTDEPIIFDFCQPYHRSQEFTFRDDHLLLPNGLCLQHNQKGVPVSASECDLNNGNQIFHFLGGKILTPDGQCLVSLKDLPEIGEVVRTDDCQKSRFLFDYQL